MLGRYLRQKESISVPNTSESYLLALQPDSIAGLLCFQVLQDLWLHRPKMTAHKAQINMPLSGWLHENMTADESGYENL
jgi:hypothetical protein